MTNFYQVPFNRSVVQPVQCLKDGWSLIKDRYWLFFAMTLVALMIGSALPLGILMGPMMCGLFLALFKLRRGEMIEFGTLFKGFDYFGQSVIAALLQTIPVIVVAVPAYIIFYAGFFLSLVAMGDEPNPAAGIAFFVIFALFIFVVALIIIVISIGFIFSFPLIVDRGLPGMEAVKLSFKAGMANFWGLLGCSLLGALLGLAGLLLCFVGIYLVFPLSYATYAVAYEKVFGLHDPNEVITNLPPPPPSFT